MAIELASAIGLGGKRESILSGLPSAVKDIGESLALAQQKKELKQKEEKKQSDAIAKHWGDKIIEAKTDDMYENDARSITNQAREAAAEITRMQMQGKSQYEINDFGKQAAAKIADATRIAQKTFNTGKDIGKYITKPDEYETSEASQAWNEYVQKPINERAKDVDVVGQQIITGKVYPTIVSLEKSLKEISPEFDPTTFVKETTIEGTNKFVIDEDLIKKERDRTISDLQMGRMPKYEKSLVNRAKRIVENTPVDVPLDATPEQVAQAKTAQLNDAMNYVFQDDWKRMQERYIEKATRERSINLPNQGSSFSFGGGYNGGFAATSVVKGDVSYDPKKAKEEYNALSAKIAGQNARIAALDRESKKSTNNKGVLESFALAQSELKSMQKEKAAMEEQMRNNAVASYTQIDISPKSRGTTFVLVDKNGIERPDAKATKILADPNSGKLIGVLATYQKTISEGKNKGKKEMVTDILPLNETASGVKNATNIAKRFREKKDDILSHLQAHQNEGRLGIETLEDMKNILTLAGKGATKPQGANTQVAKQGEKPKMKVVEGIEIPADATPVYSKTTGKLLGYETVDGKKMKVNGR